MAPDATDRLWVTWETQRRNKELAEAFGCYYLCADYSKQPRLVRYLYSAVETLTTIISRRPKIVFAQCPSVVLSIYVAILSYLFRYKLIIDCHNGGIESLQQGHPLLRRLLAWAFKRAAIVIVSNEALVKSLPGINAKELPDKLPQLHASGKTIIAGAKKPVVTVISSYAADEPLKDFLTAVKDQNFTFFVTGRRTRAGELLSFESNTIRFTDFLSTGDYDQLIRDSDLLVDLTTRENCLVCGAYEAISAGVPAILSDSEANRSLFKRGFLYSGNDANSYTRALAEFSQSPEKFKQEIRQFRAEFEKVWNEYFQAVNSELRS